MSESVITSVEQLVENASLTSIEVFKLSAERKLDTPMDIGGIEIDPVYKLDADCRSDGQGFRIRFTTEIATPFGDINCGVYAEYSNPGFFFGPQSSVAVTEFVNNVAIMHMLPYVRQNIADVTLRVYQAPLLVPLVQRGQLAFEIEISGLKNASGS